MQGSMLKGLKGRVANLLECSDDSICSSTATAGSSCTSGSLGDFLTRWAAGRSAGGCFRASTPLAAAMHQLRAQDLGTLGSWAYL